MLRVPSGISTRTRLPASALFASAPATNFIISTRDMYLSVYPIPIAIVFSAFSPLGARA